MSRAHMLYDDQPLQQETVRSSKWQGKWDPQELQRGSGVLMEGIYHKKVKYVIQDAEGRKHRYIVFHVEYEHGCQRRFDVHGKEIEPNVGQTGLVRTGYLHSSYKPEAKGTPDLLNYEELKQRVHSTLADYVTPSHAQSLCFWGEEERYEHVEIEYGQPVRLKTKGDSPFIDSLTRLDTEQKQRSTNYAGGDSAGKSWTDRVMGVKQIQEVPTTLPQDQSEGVDDDEWDD